MNTEQLKAIQGPLKEQYRVDPGSALITLRAKGRATRDVVCKVDSGRALIDAGLHPATGGDGTAVHDDLLTRPQSRGVGGPQPVDRL